MGSAPTCLAFSWSLCCSDSPSTECLFAAVSAQHTTRVRHRSFDRNKRFFCVKFDGELFKNLESNLLCQMSLVASVTFVDSGPFCSVSGASGGQRDDAYVQPQPCRREPRPAASPLQRQNPACREIPGTVQPGDHMLGKAESAW